MSERHRWTVLAHLLRPQGRKGEILADLLTDFPEQFRQRPEVYLAAPGYSGTASEARAVQITASWLPLGRNEGRIVFGLSGVDSINSAESLAGLDVLIPAHERLPLEDGSEYVDDLVGCTVYDGAQAIGVVTDVEFSATPDGTRRLKDVAPLLTVVTQAGDEVLIPFVQAFLRAQDTSAKEIRMELPAGLVDLNR